MKVRKKSEGRERIVLNVLNLNDPLAIITAGRVAFGRQVSSTLCERRADSLKSATVQILMMIIHYYDDGDDYRNYIDNEYSSRLLIIKTVLLLL